MILSTNNYGNYYYLVLRLDNNTMNNLICKKLKKLKAISNSITILDTYFDIRDLLLVMKKKDVEDINKLEKINYDDINYISKDNFKILKRLYSVDHGFNNSSLLYQGVMKSKYIYRKTASHELLKLDRIIQSNLWKQFNRFERDVNKLRQIKTFKNYDDLLEKSYNILKENYIKSELDIILRFIILNFSNCFKHEGEILVKEDFIIPDKSVLFIKEQYNLYHNEETKLIKDNLNDLSKIYNVKLLPYRIIQKDILARTHKIAFTYIRYLEKIF